MKRNETKIHAIKHVEHYDFSLDGKRYEVRHTTHPMPWHESSKGKLDGRRRGQHAASCLRQ